MIYGIDVSEYQGDFNFAQARNEGFTFVAVKCSGSKTSEKTTTYRDPWWRRNVMKASAVDASFGVRIGYHYLSGHDRTGWTQAALLWELCEEAMALGGKPWVPCVDVEDKTVDTELMYDFFNAWEKLTTTGIGVGASAERLVLYTNPSFWKTKMGNLELPDYVRLWQSHWVDEVSVRGTPGTTTAPWRYSSQQAKYIDPAWWNETRGGKNPIMLQHTNHTLVAGQWIDSSVSQMPIDALQFSLLGTAGVGLT